MVRSSIFPSSELIILTSSAIIENIITMEKSGLASLAFFYCDFREDVKRDLRGLLSSILVQLSHQSDSYCHIISKFYSDHANGSKHPGEDELLLIFHIGSDGFIVRSTTFDTAFQHASGTLYTNYLRHLMGHTTAPCEISIRKSGILPTVSFNVSQ